MIIVKNIFGRDPADINDDNAAYRIGWRIRRIREARKMKISELAEKVGISSDMLQKYENGQRKPKTERLKTIAYVLGVSSLALTDPTLLSDEGCMFALFEMEENHKLSVEKIEGQFYLKFNMGSNESMNYFLGKWYEKKESITARMKDASDEEKKTLMQEYYDWEWTFPEDLLWKPSRDDKEKERAALQKRLEELDEDLKNEGE